MHRPNWVTRPVIVVALVVVLCAAVAVGVIVAQSGGKHGSSTAGTDVTTKIPVGGGVTLTAEVISPAGKGPFPLIVMPASWGSGADEYRILGRGFAAAGYQVVSYGQRGFKGSGGQIDFAGSDTRQDASRVIDWALDHTHADADHIGMLGISYGGGVSLLAAAHDKRIKAVAAMSAWADYAAAFVPHHTLNSSAMHSLFDTAGQTGKLDSDVASIAQELDDSPSAAADRLEQLSPTRSAMTDIAALNRNKPAIFLANAFQDSLVDPSQLVPFFNALTTPKRLQLSTGEHTGPELPGLLGRPDPTMLAAAQWLDHYLGGKNNGADRASDVVLQDGATGAFHQYPSWPANRQEVKLAAPGTAGNMVATTPASWSHPLTTGTDSGATSGGEFIAAPGQFQPTKINSTSLRGADAWVWSAAPVGSALVISGSPQLKLNVSSSAPAVTLYAYLYDADASGAATLMSYAPATVSNGTATIKFRPMSWTVAAGHHAELVVDTVDSRYAAAEPAGTSVTLSSPASLTFGTG